MSHFCASIHGSAKTDATRRGTKESGIQGHIRGRELGVRVVGVYDEEKDEDTFEIFATPGSNGAGPVTTIAVLRRKRAEPLVRAASPEESRLLARSPGQA